MNTRFILSISWTLLAVFAGSAGVTCLKALEGASAVLKTVWRLQISWIGQLPFFLYEFIRNPKKSPSFLQENVWLILLSSLFLTGHYILLAISAYETSVAHSICFMSASPVFVVLIQLFTKSKPSVFQIIGVFIGFGGLVAMALTASENDGSTFYGDLIALLSGNCLLVYLYIGKYIGSDDVLWLYLCPLNFFASIVCLILFVSTETENIYRLLHWTSTTEVLYILYLGIAPGILAHGTYNYMIKALSPILVTSFINFAPLFGTVVGILVGLQELPTVYTWIGGGFLVLGNTITTLAEKNKSEYKVLPEDETSLNSPVIVLDMKR